MAHQLVRRRLMSLKADLSNNYQSAITAPTSKEDQPQLVALCVDLMRKEHCALPFHALTPKEQRMVLHAHGVEKLPAWMSRYAALSLSSQNRKLIGQLRDIKSSRPDQPKQYFTAIRHQQQLRSVSKG